MKPRIFTPNDYKQVQREVTDLNADGHEEAVEHNHCGTPECCGQCDTASTGEEHGEKA